MKADLRERYETTTQTLTVKLEVTDGTLNVAPWLKDLLEKEPWVVEAEVSS